MVNGHCTCFRRDFILHFFIYNLLNKFNNLSVEMTNAGVHFVLKVFTGPHKGAEVELFPNQEITLGRDESCDIVLIDVGLSPKHLVISMNDSEVFIEPVENSSLQIDGIVCEKRTKLSNFQQILACKTVISVGPSGADWPEISTEVKPASEATAENAPATEGDSTPAEKSEAEDSSEVVNQQNDNNGAVVVPVEQNNKKSIVLKIFVAVIISLLVLIVAVLFFLSPQESMQKQDVTISKPWLSSKDELLKKLTTFCANNDLFTIEERPNGFSIVAYVKTNAERNTLIKELRDVKKARFSRITVYSQENFINSAVEILKINGVSLNVFATPNLDTITLSGYLYNINSLDTIRKKLFTDIAGLVNLKISVLSPEDVYDMASNILNKYSLGALLQIKTITEGIIITGIIDVRNSEEWRKANKELTKIFKEICKISTQISITTPKNINKTYFNTPITSVTVSEDSDIACIYLKNGDKYFESSQLPNGYTIERINTNGVVLIKGTETVTLKFDEL